MAFVLSKIPETFTAPVTFKVPADNGKKKDASFTAKFKYLGADKVQELLDRLNASTEKYRALEAQRKAEEQADPTAVRAPLPRPEFTDRDTLDIVLAGFGPDVLAEDGQPLPFTPENVDALLKVHGVGAAMVKSFFDHHFEAREKN